MLDDFTEFHYLDDTTEEVEIELPYTSIRRIRAVSAAAAAAAATTVSSHGEDGPAAAKVPKPSGVLRIVQRAGLFLVYEDDELLGGLDGDFMVLRNADSDGVSAGYTENKAGFQPPGFGITFLGTDDIDVVGGSTNTTSGCVNSSGGGNIINNSNSNSSINNNNSNNNNNNNSNSIGSCCCCCSGTHHTGFIIWVGGTGVLVDPPPSTRAYLGAVGLRVNKVVLTHCHNEHDGGLAGMTFADERITVYSTRTIYESYVRKQLAISGRDVRGYQDFVAVRTGEPLAIGGAEFEFDYSLHTVPCLGFRVRYRGCAISYSGDTRYDPACFQAAVARGVMTPRREASLRMRGFDADLILHELGSGPFHTAACVLNDLPWDIKRKMLVVHCRDVPAAATDPQTGATVPVADLRAPRAGIEHTVALPLGDYEEGYATGSRRLQLICATPFLRGMYAPDLYGIFAAATEQSFPAGAVVIDGAAAASGRLYLISEGQAMMYSEEDKPITLNPRDMFGAFDGITTRIVAQTTLKVLSFSAEIFARLPRVGNEVLRMLKYRPFIQSSLAKSTVFKDLTQNQISVLSSCVSEEIVLAKNQTLIRQGDTSDRSLYIVRTGSIRVQLSNTNPPIEIARLGPGNCVGEMAVLLRKPRSADVIANEPIVVLRISQEAISDAMERYPYIRYALMDLVAHRSGRPTKSARPAERPMHMPPPPPGPFKKQQQQMMPPPPLPPPPSSQLSLTKTKDGDTGNNNNNNNNNNTGENIHIGTNFPKPPSQMISLPCIITNNNNNNNCNNGSDKKGVN